jgi:CheY-like chemotaxis protein
MPGMNGLDVARHVRASKRARGTLLVALSGWEEDEQRREAFNAGYDHFLAKPVDVNSIRAFMSKLAGGTEETQ